MELDSYYQQIIQQLQQKIYFPAEDVMEIEFLKTLGNVPEQVTILNEYMTLGNIEGIKNFPSAQIKTTYDDYTCLLVTLKPKRIIVCVWDSDELWDDPVIVSFREIQRIFRFCGCSRKNHTVVGQRKKEFLVLIAVPTYGCCRLSLSTN